MVGYSSQKMSCNIFSCISDCQAWSEVNCSQTILVVVEGSVLIDDVTGWSIFFIWRSYKTHHHHHHHHHRTTGLTWCRHSSASGPRYRVSVTHVVSDRRSGKTDTSSTQHGMMSRLALTWRSLLGCSKPLRLRKSVSMPLIPGVCGKLYEFHTPTRDTTNETVRNITGFLPASDRVTSFDYKFLARSDPEEDHHRVIAAAPRLQTDWRRPVGRPRTTWLKTTDEDVQPQNFGVHTAWKKTKDRDNWQQVVSTATLCYRSPP